MENTNNNGTQAYKAKNNSYTNILPYHITVFGVMLCLILISFIQ